MTLWCARDVFCHLKNNRGSSTSEVLKTSQSTYYMRAGRYAFLCAWDEKFRYFSEPFPVVAIEADIRKL